MKVHWINALLRKREKNKDCQLMMSVVMWEMRKESLHTNGYHLMAITPNPALESMIKGSSNTTLVDCE